jgi:para-aminobenzoate synthetase/4-amino-4-deoxychorismate lyase
MWILFDDAREGGAVPRLYRDPVERIEAHRIEEVAPALERVRAGLKAGRYAAGYHAYEAGYAIDP